MGSVEGDIGTIGITDHAQQELGDIVYVDLPKVGSAASRKARRSARSSRSRRSRISIRRFPAKSSRSTKLLADAPEKLNDDPHGAAWLVKIRLSAPDEVRTCFQPRTIKLYRSRKPELRYLPKSESERREMLASLRRRIARRPVYPPPVRCQARIAR